MAASVNTTTQDGNTVLNVQPNGESEITLATAGTYVDKNIVVNIEGLSASYDSANERLILANFGS